MGIQPSLYMIDSGALKRVLGQGRAPLAGQCRHLNPDRTLHDEACWQRFLGKSLSCCDFCTPGAEPPLSVLQSASGTNVVFFEQGLPKHMYLWAKLHYDDEFSWTLASSLDDVFWQYWSCLTQRTVHLTCDVDRRGLCGFLTVDELSGFVGQLSRVILPNAVTNSEGLDLYESAEQFESLQVIRSYAERCITQSSGLAWVHDMLI